MPADQDEAGVKKENGAIKEGKSALKDDNFPVLVDNNPNEPSQASQTVVDEDDVSEWEAMADIPEHWRPLPLFQVRNIPISEDIQEGDVKALIESVPDLKVRSVVFDERQNERMLGRRSALIRLQPPPLPSKDSADANKSSGEMPHDGDAVNVAAWAVVRLRKAQPPLQLGGETVAFETGSPQVQLYIGNLSREWQVDSAFVDAMEKYGRLERAFVMRNSAGMSKGYGFVEFSLPSAALACKQAMDEIERNMRPDPRKQKDKATQQKPENDGMKAEPSEADGGEGKQAQALRIGSHPDNSGRLVKLLRAEWATMRRIDALFSKVLYVANLRTTQNSHKELRDIFEQFGKVAEVTVPRNKATNATKGFAFVAFANGLAADRAYRALEKSGSEEIGGALVSFANSAKATDSQSRAAGGKQAPGQRQQQGGAMGRNAAPPFPPRGGPQSGGPLGRSPGGGRGGGGNFGGRMLPPGGMPMGMEDDTLRHRQLHMQAGIAAQAQMQRQLEQRMQMQMQQQQLQMQAQLRQAQMQVQQAQQQAQQLQRQAQQAQAKAAAEAEARKRAEDEARRAAAAAARGEGIGTKRGAGAMYPGGGYGSGGPDAGGSRAASSGYGSQGYGSGAGYGPTGSSGFGAMGGGYGVSASTGYGAAGGASSGYGSQGYGASSQAGYTEYGAAGYGGSDYDASGAGYGAGGEYGGGEDMAYGTAAAGGYDDGYSGYGAQSGGYDRSGASGMRKPDYGGYGAADAGYGGAEAAGFDQHAAYSGYGQAGGGSQKRQNPYQQGGYGGYGSGGGGYGMQGGGEYGKRQRY